MHSGCRSQPEDRKSNNQPGDDAAHEVCISLLHGVGRDMRDTKATAAFRIPEIDLTEVAGNEEMANTDTREELGSGSLDSQMEKLWHSRSSVCVLCTVSQGGKFS